MAKAHSVFTCQSCGSKSPRWQGKCNDCGSWNSFVEETVDRKAAGSKTSSSSRTGNEAVSLFDELNFQKLNSHRMPSGFAEIDRVLGGGFVPGSLLLFGGEPGIGKSTFLLQIVGKLAAEGHECLYISGEESGPQVAARAIRLGLDKKLPIQFLSTASLNEARDAIDKVKPKFIVADSVQTLSSEDMESAAGTVSQVREVTQVFLEIAKRQGITTMLVGHITKEGSIAGPKLLEHMVDAVFYFEQAASGGYRLLRGQKNRFGPTHELAVLEMTGKGLTEVLNPSARFLAERSKEMPGSAVIAHLEGSRPFLTEVQALTQKCYFGYPRRTVQGVDQNRIAVLLAVIEKQLGLSFAEIDVYCKVASGARVEEPAADLAILFALVSAAKNKAIPPDVLLVGEVGLGGELRSVPGVASRLSEGKSVGLKRGIIPVGAKREIEDSRGVEVLTAQNIKQVAELLGF